MPEPKLDDIVSNIKAGDPKDIDEAIKGLTLLRDAARQAGNHLLAEKIHKIIGPANKAIEALIKPYATKEAAALETITQSSATINGKDNNNNNNTNNITKQMGQSERVLRP